MNIKISKFAGFLAFSSLFFGFSLLSASVPTPFKAGTPVLAAPNAGTVENMEITPAADNVAPPKSLPAGFYQFNNLVISNGYSADAPPATIELIQKNDGSCAVYGNGKSDQPISCIFSDGQDNIYAVQVDERTTILGIHQEPALLSDFAANDRMNVLGWLSSDSKTIRAAVIRNLENKNFHQSISGAIKNVKSDGFSIVLENGDEIQVKTPIIEGTQVTINGVFDKVGKTISDVLSIIIKPIIAPQQQETAAVQPETPPAAPPSAKPSTLFRNFLKIFGL